MRSLPELRALLSRLAHPAGRDADALPTPPRVLILTPLKDAADCLPGYAARLRGLTYPHAAISLGLLESDSSDDTIAVCRGLLPGLRAAFRRVDFWKRDFGYRLPPGIHRGAPEIQIERRTVLARSRNHLLLHALTDEDWVLWMDVDVVEYPPDIIERLLATGKDIIQPHCVLAYGGRTFDENGWIDEGRYHLDAFRGKAKLVELHAVGGTILLVRADVHRDGLVFPPFLYGRANPRIRRDRGEGLPTESRAGEIETEGLGMMAWDMGHSCWGMPDLEVIHRNG